MKRIAVFALALIAATSAHAAVTISNAKTKHMKCAGGVCTPTGGNANLNVSELQSMLTASDVTVKSSASAPSLGVLDPLTWASTHHLTLDAYQSIHVRAPIVIEGTSGLTLTTNDGGTGGNDIFEDGGYANFWDLASSLVINGQNYVLVGDIKTLAGDIQEKAAGHYALAAGYDASPDGVYSAAPIQKPLTGTFTGLGNTISHFTLSGERPGIQRGLFAEIAAQGAVRNLTLTGASVSGGIGVRSVTGTLAATNSGYIYNVSAGGSASGPATVGGLAGINNGKIESSDADVAVTAFRIRRARRQEAFAGGLVGTNSGSLVDCHAKGSVILNEPIPGKAEIGGLAGENQQLGTIALSSASGSVSGPVEVGGLVGDNAGSITQSFASSDVTSVFARGGTSLGGLVGVSQYASAVSDSYSTGSVTKGRDAHGDAGGLLGAGAGTFATSYATGKVSGKHRLGGFAGAVTNTLNAAYWDISTSGWSRGVGWGPVPDGLTGLTDDQLKSGLPAGFDPNVWGQNPSINNGWPYLLANPPQ